MMDIALLKQDLLRDEGLRLKPYLCPAGKRTIGVGRNLDECGITRAEVMMLLENDIAIVGAELDRALPWWRTLPDGPARALANMAFNMGISPVCWASTGCWAIMRPQRKRRGTTNGHSRSETVPSALPTS